MTKKPVIFYRESAMEKEDLVAAKNHFPCDHNIVGLKDNLVICRLSALPFYEDIEESARRQGSQLINSFKQHRYVATFNYYKDIEEFTPKTYFSLEEIRNHPGPFVVKGETNSKKLQWSTMMFAPTVKDAIRITNSLQEDALIRDQRIIYREYVKLKTFEIGINDLPFTNEWRLFFYKNTLLSYGYYWSIADTILKKEDLPKEALEFAERVAKKVSPNVNFFVMDIAETEAGDWIVIELNDGQQSGLSENEPEELYKNLAKALSEEK